MSETTILREAEAVRALVSSLEAYKDDQLVLDSIQGETGFLEACAKVIDAVDDDDARMFGLEKKIADLELRRARVKKRQEARRAILEQAMAIAEQSKIELPTCTLVLAKRAPSVVYTDESAIPAKFWKAADPSLDKRAVAAALKEGEAVPGASLSNAPPSLTIKRQ